MGQKVNPIAFRLGIIRGCESEWFANKKDFARKLHEDLKIREFIDKYVAKRVISKMVIERTLEVITVTIHTGRPGVLIGPNGSKVQELKEALQKRFKKKIRLNIYEIKNEDLDASLVAQNLAYQISSRSSSYKREVMRTLENISRQGVSGQILVSGRLGGAEIARKEAFKKGRVPRHTLRSDIDYAFAESLTTYGKIGIKVWLYKGDVYGKRNLSLNVSFLKDAKRRGGRGNRS